MNSKKFKFGSNAPVTVETAKRTAANAKAKVARKSVVVPGLEQNTHTKYDCETSFTNIKPVVNVTRTKLEPTLTVGVAKGAILDNVPITVPSNTAGATMHAMKKRCDYAPSLEHMEDFLTGHKLLMDKFTPLEEIRLDKGLFDRYLEKCAPGKAERLLAALGNHELQGDFATKHVFAKQEVLLKPHGAQPRVVYQGTDMYNALTGPIVMELNDRMKRVFSRENPLNTGNVAIYACGASGEELGAIMDEAEGSAIESDAKNNDGSQSKEFRRPEAMFYLKLGAPKWFVQEFAKNTSTRVWTRYGVCAQVDGQRWSGETTTTTGNSYVHMALMQAALHNAGVERSTNIHGGDDYLGFVSGEVETFKESVEKTYKVSGMVAEVVPQSTHHRATFYRKRYVRTPHGSLPVPQFGRVLAKINIRANQNSNVNDREYMAGKYLSAAYEHRHVPGIPELLLATSERLSDKPHLDVRQSKAVEMGGVKGVRAIVERSRKIDADNFGGFLSEVYGVSQSELADVYARVAESCVDFCNGWTYVDKGKTKNRPGSHKYSAPVMRGSVVDNLTRLDT